MDGWGAETAPEALERHAPEAARIVEQLIAATPAPGGLAVARTVRAVCGETLNLPPLPVPLPSSGGRGPLAGSATGVADFAEQFSLDVSAMPEGARGEMVTAFGADTRAFFALVYVADQLPRLRSGLDALFPGGVWPAPDVFTEADPWPLIDGFMVEVARLANLDPVTTELVRLRGARQHGCRRCKSLRSRSALDAGADEAVFAAIDDYEHSTFTERHKAALAYTDALIWRPGYLPDDAIAGVRRHFTVAEAVELTCDVVRNACNKIAVAAGTDAARVSEGVELYDINADGTVAYEQ